MQLLEMQRSQVLVLLLLILIPTGVLAQERMNDVIVKRDSSKISCKVLVVNDQTVQYKKSSDPEGPLFHILKSDIARLIYGNGETEVFQTPAASTISPNQGAVILYPVSPWRMPGFVENLSVWKPEELKSASNYYKSSAKKSKTVSVVFVSVGAAASITGLVLLATRDRHDTYYTSDRVEQGWVAIVAGLGVGIIGGVTSHSRTIKYRRNATQVDEELSRRKLSFRQLRIRPSLNALNRSASVSLVLHF